MCTTIRVGQPDMSAALQRGGMLLVNFDISFLSLPCSVISLDAMDVSGEVSSHVYVCARAFVSVCACVCMCVCVCLRVCHEPERHACI
jgi:hypothetical protein